MRPQSLIQPNESISQDQVDQINGRLEIAFDHWIAQADCTGTLSFFEILRQVERNWAIDGDVFIRIHLREKNDQSLPLALEVIAADRVQTPPEHAGDKQVRMGVHVSEQGEKLGFFVLKSDPADTLDVRQEYEYVSALNAQGRPQMLQMVEPLFPGQLRGVPAITPVLSDVKDLKDLREAVVIREQVRACFTAFIKRIANPYDAARSEANENYGGYRIQDIAPGRVDYLGQDEEVQFAEPGNGASEFANFTDRSLLSIAAGLNWPYSWLTKDYRRSTYSSERMALIDGGRVVESRQQNLEFRLLRHVWGWLVELAVYSGLAEIDPVDFLLNQAHFLNHSWIPPGVPWLDPLKDVKATILAVNNNLQSRYNAIAKTGGDPEKVSSQRSREIEWDRQWKITPIDQVRETEPEQEPDQQEQDPA